MLHNNLGQQVKHEQGIFPLIAINDENKSYKCLGTAFFINTAGWFVTAKHVLYDNNDQLHPLIMGVQTLSNETQVLREVNQLSVHPNADIVIGILGVARDKDANIVSHELTHYFKLSFKKLDIDNEVIAFGFPRTTSFWEGAEITFTCIGKWSQGEIKEFHPNGFTLLRNRCYQTSMFIDTGASGGPVFNDNFVVGINSTGWDLLVGETPISFITPIDLLLDLSIELEDFGLLSMSDLIERQYIKVKY